MADDDALTALANGEMTVQGEFVWGSNYTFLAEVQHGETRLKAVYKPVRGERPLWDFPARTLARREAAAYLVSEALGWRLAPPTVFRKRHAPLGPGSLQLLIEHDPNLHYFTFSEEDRQRLRPAALFDVLINNADRKGSHILRDDTGHLWLIDHGICFHEAYKLRTVVWDFAGEAIPPALLADVQRMLAEMLPFLGKNAAPLESSGPPDSPAPAGAASAAGWVAALEAHLNPAEIAALAARARRLLASGRFPNPPENQRSIPWPPV